MFLDNHKESIRRFLPRRMKQHRIRGGPLKGNSIYTSWHDYPAAIRGKAERPLLDWFARHVQPGQTWLDVGAHYGYTALALSRLVGNSGRVFAFEPVVGTAGCISRTRALNGLSSLYVIPVALSGDAHIGIGRLSLIRGMADSTIPQQGWREPFLHCAFDRLWPTLAEEVPSVHGIKIDVQGMEFEVLRGMRRTLAEHRPKLVVEFHEGVDRQQILELLRDCGYENAGQPVDSDAPPGTLCPDNQSYAFFPAEPLESLTVRGYDEITQIPSGQWRTK
jgi:FkbM family methyltransferase